MHQDFIFYTSGSVGCKAGAFTGIKRGDALDQPDGSDGNEVLLVGSLGVVLFHNVRDEAEISLDQDIARLQIAVCAFFEVIAFFFQCQRLGKRAAGRESERIEHAAEHQPNAGA